MAGQRQLGQEAVYDEWGTASSNVSGTAPAPAPAPAAPGRSFDDDAFVDANSGY
jgi:hypothetical protein